MTCDHPVRPGEYVLCADCASKLTTEVELSHKSLKVFRDSLNNVAKQRDVAKEIAESVNLQNGAFAEAICSAYEALTNSEYSDTQAAVDARKKLNTVVEDAVNARSSSRQSNELCKRCGGSIRSDGVHACSLRPNLGCDLSS